MKKLEINGASSGEFERILTRDAMEFILELHERFELTRQQLLQRRREVQTSIDASRMPDFLPDTQNIRTADWKIAPTPREIQDRRVEITGPVDRKMIINALNSKARVFMADLEDSHSPTWKGNIEGQINLYDAVRRTISYSSPEGKKYFLDQNSNVVLFVRPRGWHLDEKHVLIDGKPISASLFDFGIFFFHNAAEQLRRGTRPYFYLPKMESHLEARLWNDVFVFAQKRLGLSHGSIRATVLIETILASFEMHEILFELKDHSAGLNCGRWDYIFSFIKKFREHSDFVLPDRSQLAMESHFLKSYSDLLIQTCHRRGAHAIGGMAAYIPNKSNPDADRIAIANVVKDKEREVKAGYDGTWVAHPGLAEVANTVFDKYMPTPNQIEHQRNDVRVSASDLLQAPAGEITEKGLRVNVQVALWYIESWLRGVGCLALNGLMEDAATAEISRTQIWQWVRFEATLENGTPISSGLVRGLIREEIRLAQESLGDQFKGRKFEQAATVLEELAFSSEFIDFLTSNLYNDL